MAKKKKKNKPSVKKKEKRNRKADTPKSEVITPAGNSQITKNKGESEIKVSRSVDPPSTNDEQPKEIPAASQPPGKIANPPRINTILGKIDRHGRLDKRIRRMLPDLISVLIALIVVVLGSILWWQPPLFTCSFPATSFSYKRGPAMAATLYRPVAMRQRYYIQLPEKIENRYEWFAVDRRREVVALSEEPQHQLLGVSAIRRSDPLGLDLEFRTIDGHEWLIHFHRDAIVFSNNLLKVRVDTGNPDKGAPNSQFKQPRQTSTAKVD
jgi:hypothetical protein